MKHILDPKKYKEIKSISDSIKHWGDYGYTYYNPETETIHWVGSDGDGMGEDHNGNILTTFEEIEEMFKKLPYVKEVVIGDENFPTRSDGDEYEDVEEDDPDYEENPWIEIK